MYVPSSFMYKKSTRSVWNLVIAHLVFEILVLSWFKIKLLRGKKKILQYPRYIRKNQFQWVNWNSQFWGCRLTSSLKFKIFYVFYAITPPPFFFCWNYLGSIIKNCSSTNQLINLTLTLDLYLNHEYSAELNVFINLHGMTAIAYKQ